LCNIVFGGIGVQPLTNHCDKSGGGLWGGGGWAGVMVLKRDGRKEKSPKRKKTQKLISALRIPHLQGGEGKQEVGRLDNKQLENYKAEKKVVWGGVKKRKRKKGKGGLFELLRGSQARSEHQGGEKWC